MPRRLVLMLMLLAALVLMPMARASQPCCEQGCDAMPACVSVCALCASPAAWPAPEPLPQMAVPKTTGPVMLSVACDDWIAEIWTPPD